MVTKIDLNILSNRNIKFENKRGKWLTYQIGEGKPIRLNVKDLFKQIRPNEPDGITGTYGFSCYTHGEMTSLPQYKYEVAMGLKHTIMERNLYVINGIVDQKNKKIVNIWLKIVHYIVKFITCGKVNLIEKIKYKKIRPSLAFPNPDPKIPVEKRHYGWMLEKVRRVSEAHPPLATYLQIKHPTVETSQIPPLVQAGQAYIEKGGEIEDFFEFNHPGWTVKELYEMDPDGIFIHGDHWMNGHRMDK